MIDVRTEQRTAVLRAMGAGSSEIAELLSYSRTFFPLDPASYLSFPLSDEPFIANWTQYAQCSEATGSISFLRDYLVQMRFPIRAGLSKTTAYQDVTLRGRDPSTVAEATGLPLIAPEKCKIVIHPSSAGRIPLLIAGLREDFVALTQALSGRNEPIVIPDAMGACCIAGYNNWHRISQLKQASTADGPEELQNRIMPDKHLYQERFIILSDGPYSGVAAADLGLADDEWHAISLIIRREHECTHYFTRRVFSSMRNHLLDELIADYCGIYAAAGRYRAAWFLRFMGLEDYPRYRAGGRLERYRGDPPLSDAAFQVLQKLVVQAAGNLESWSERYPRDSAYSPSDPRVIMTLTRLTLEELASLEAATLLLTSVFGPRVEPEKDTQ